MRGVSSDSWRSVRTSYEVVNLICKGRFHSNFNDPQVKKIIENLAAYEIAIVAKSLKSHHYSPPKELLDLLLAAINLQVENFTDKELVDCIDGFSFSNNILRHNMHDNRLKKAISIATDHNRAHLLNIKIIICIIDAIHYSNRQLLVNERGAIREALLNNLKYAKLENYLYLIKSNILNEHIFKICIKVIADNIKALKVNQLSNILEVYINKVKSYLVTG